MYIHTEPAFLFILQVEAKPRTTQWVTCLLTCSNFLFKIGFFKVCFTWREFFSAKLCHVVDFYLLLKKTPLSWPHFFILAQCLWLTAQFMLHQQSTSSSLTSSLTCFFLFSQCLWLIAQLRLHQQAPPLHQPRHPASQSCDLRSSNWTSRSPSTRRSWSQRNWTLYDRRVYSWKNRRKSWARDWRREGQLYKVCFQSYLSMWGNKLLITDIMQQYETA